MDIHDLEYTEPWEWPTDASREIMRVLRDKSATEEDRALAAELAGDFVVINDELANELMSVVQDPEEPVEVRARAASAFGPALEHSDCCDWSDEDDVIISEEVFDRMRQTLRKVNQDESAPKLVRRRALEAAVRAPEEWQSAVIRDAYKTGDTEWQMTAVFSMGYVGGFNKQIVEALQSRSMEVRFEAMRAAGMREIGEAWPAVEAVLKSNTPDRAMLLAAIEAAPYVNAAEAGGFLADYVDSLDEEVSDAASEALQVMMGMKGADELADFEEDEFEINPDLDEEGEEDDEEF